VRDIISRKEALERGLVRFYTGVSCKHGHLCERFSSSGGCVQCVNPKVHRTEIRGRNLGWPERGLNFSSHLSPEEAAAVFRYIEDAGWHNEALNRIRTNPSLQARYAPILPREEVAKLKAALDRDALARNAMRAATDSHKPTLIQNPTVAPSPATDRPSPVRLKCGHEGMRWPGHRIEDVICPEGCPP
jgi:hypothetical protein